MVYEILRGADGKWTAQRWHALPGAARQVGVTASGELVLDSHGGGTVAIAADRALRFVDCGVSRK